MPYPHWPQFGQAEEDAVLRVIRSGQWGRLAGFEVAQFEAEFAVLQQAKYGLAVNSGTVALKLALLASGIQAGDEVIVPAYTFIATATAVVEANAVPVFVDIHPDTYCIAPDAVERAITPRTRAILPVHFGGQCADMEAINALAKAHHLTVIEDASHAHGGKERGRMLGSIGDFGCFSFQASKNLNCGEGGFVMTNDEEKWHLLCGFHNNGRIPGNSRHDYEILGGNYRMPELSGALLRAQLTRLGEQTACRDANGRYLNEQLAQIPGIRPLVRDYGDTLHPYHLYMFCYDAAICGMPRADFCARLQAQGIPAHGGYGCPLYRQRVFVERRFGPFSGAGGYDADVDANAARCPVSERACTTEAVWLGQNVLLGTLEQMTAIVQAVQRVF
jgi:dTDP-4-amino-4,6-dideoxygalactose transaminase